MWSIGTIFKPIFVLFIVGFLFYLSSKIFRPSSSEPLLLLAGDSGEYEDINIVLILCNGDNSKAGNKFKRQLRQTSVLLKSIVLFTKSSLTLHVIVNDDKVFERFEKLFRSWPDYYRQKLRIRMKYTWFPEGRENMRGLFRMCATQRLFLPEMLPEVESALYVDTDFIFLKSIEMLWSEFSDFSDENIIGMTSNLYHYNNGEAKLLYVGTSGVNAGIMLMNFTRIRSFPESWHSQILTVFDKYKKRITLADQDILNVYFHFNPELLYQLPCNWNYRIWQCLAVKKNRCVTAEQYGIFALHGNALSFVSENEKKFETVFSVLEEFELGLSDFQKDFVEQLQIRLLNITESKCSKVKRFDDMILQKIFEVPDISNKTFL